MLGLRITVACYRWFGRPLSLVLVHAIVAYFFLTGRAQRRASLAYLRRVASAPEGARALGRAPGTWASFLHFRAFALSIFDRLVLWFGRERDLALRGDRPRALRPAAHARRAARSSSARTSAASTRCARSPTAIAAP